MVRLSHKQGQMFSDQFIIKMMGKGKASDCHKLGQGREGGQIGKIGTEQELCKAWIDITRGPVVSHCVPFRRSKASAGIRAQGEAAAEWPALGSKQVKRRQSTVGPGDIGRSQVASPGESGSRQISHHKASNIGHTVPWF